MIELSTSSLKPSALTSVPTVPGAAAGGFMQTLAAFLDAATGGQPPAPGAAGSPDGRQTLADDGKALPGDDGSGARDPALIWLPVPLPQQLPTARPVALTVSGGRAQVDTGTILPGSPAKAGAQSGDPRDWAPASAGEQPGAAPPAPTTMVSATIDATMTQPVMSADIAARDAPRPPPPASADLASSPTVAPTAQPAGQVFAAAIAAAAGNHERTTPDDDRATPGVSTTPTATAAQIEMAHRPVVQPASEARHAPLDLRDDRGLQGMIDRIEVLRDDANARDTRIRLVPDALGSIDLSVRKDGDAVHVHFTAENQTTRTLLTDAQPRLAELAEARGVKLGGSTVDAGTGGGGANHQPRFEPARPRTTPAATAVAVDAEPSTDQRLA